MIFILLIISLAQKFSNIPSVLYSSSNLIDLKRSTGFLINHTDMGFIGLMLLILVDEEKTKKVFGVYLFALMLATLGGSKAGIIFIILSLVVYNIFYLKIFPKIIALTVIAVLTYLIYSNITIVCLLEKSVCDWNSPLKVAHPLGYIYPYYRRTKNGWQTRETGRHCTEASPS